MQTSVKKIFVNESRDVLVEKRKKLFSQQNNKCRANKPTELDSRRGSENVLQ